MNKKFQMPNKNITQDESSAISAQVRKKEW